MGATAVEDRLVQVETERERGRKRFKNSAAVRGLKGILMSHEVVL